MTAAGELSSEAMADGLAVSWDDQIASALLSTDTVEP